MSKQQATRINPEQAGEALSAEPGKRKLRFNVTKVDTPIPPGGFIYAGCICAGGLFFPRKTGAEIP